MHNNPLKYTDPSGYFARGESLRFLVRAIEPWNSSDGGSPDASGGAIPPAPPLGSGPFSYRTTHWFWVNDWIDSNNRSWLVDLSNSGGRFESAEGHGGGGHTVAQTVAANSEAQATHVQQQVFVGPVEDLIPCDDQASSAASGLIAAGGLMATVADVVGEVEWNGVVRTVGRNLGVATTIAGGLADASEGRVLTSVVGVSLGLGSAVASFYGFPVAATALSFSALAYGVGSMFLESEGSRTCP